MSEVKNATTEQIEDVQQQINTEKTTIGIKTIKEVKFEFDKLPGATSEEKYLMLLEAYNKQKKEEDRFVLDSQMEAITSALDTARKQVDSIESLVNQRKQKLKEVYIDDIGAKLELVAHHIENEKVLKAEIIELKNEFEDGKKELELLQNRFQEKEMMVSEGKNKIGMLESENKVLVTKNSELVHIQNNYEKELREKDAEINSKVIDIDRLKNTHKEELEALKESYKADLDKLQESYKVKISELEKDNAVHVNKVSNLEANIVNIDKQNTELKASIDVIRKEAKEDIKELEKEHREEVKALEVNIKELEKANNLVELEKAKMESKIESLSENMKGLHEERNGLKQDLNTCNDALRNKETEVKNKDTELEKLNSSLSSIQVELTKNKKDLDKATKENKGLKAEIKELKKGVN